MWWEHLARTDEAVNVRLREQSTRSPSSPSFQIVLRHGCRPQRERLSCFFGSVPHWLWW